MINKLIFQLERLESVARALIGYTPTAAEVQLRASCFMRLHEFDPGMWVRQLMPTPVEVGHRPLPGERYQEFLELGARSFDELPSGTTLSGEMDLRGHGLLRHYLKSRTARLFAPLHDIPAPLQSLKRSLDNAVVASEDDCCASTLTKIRGQGFLYLMRGGDQALFLAQLGERAKQRRDNFLLDAHLPASLRIASDLAVALRKKMQDGAFSEAECNSILRSVLDAFFDEQNRVDGLGGRLASVFATRGLEDDIEQLLSDYRDEVHRARKHALSALEHASMMKAIFDALPVVLAADDLAKMMLELRGGVRFERIARMTDEELVRFSNALVIRSWAMIWPADLRHKVLLERARAKGRDAVDALIEHWRGGLVFPDAILEKMRMPPPPP